MRNSFTILSLFSVLTVVSCQDLNLTSGSPAPQGPPPPPSTASKNLLGINLSPTDDWSEDRLFADAMKQARIWNKGKTILNPQVPAALDAHFWPTEDACLIVMDLRRNEGTYRCSFQGEATVTAEPWGLGGTGSIKNVVYHADTGRTTFEIVLTQATGPMTLAFSGTKGGIRDLKIMRPKARYSTESYPEGTLFTDPIQTLVSKFQVIRFMDFLRINGSTLAHWSDRPLPTDASFAWEYRSERGSCYEYAIALCNQTHRDLWLNIPLRADDDFVKNLAKLVKDGGNGYPGLDPGLNVYLEYSNELWNTSFSQSSDNFTLAVAEEAGGKTPSLKAADPGVDQGLWAYRRVGRRLLEISDLFREVWGDAAMPAPGKASPRVRPVLEAWQGMSTPFEGTILTFLDQNYRDHPLNWYFYGTGGSGYYYPDDTKGLTLDTVWTNYGMDFNFWRDAYVRPEVTLAKAFGLKRIAYEGGPSFDKGFGDDALREAAWGDPRMQQNLVDHVDKAWSAADSDLFVFYITSGDYQWGFTQDIFNLDTPKIRAINQLLGQNKAPVTLGKVPPFTVNGVDCDNILNYGASPNESGTDYILRDRNYVIYSFRTTGEAKVTLTLNLGLAKDKVQVFCDGQSQVVLPAGNYEAAPPAPVVLTGLKPGLHSILIRTGADGVTIHSLTFAN